MKVNCRNIINYQLHFYLDKNEMKNLTLESACSVIFLSLGLAQGCQKAEENTVLKKCDLSGEIISAENKIATVIYTDKVSGAKVAPAFFIIEANLEKTSLPLKVCNFPIEQYPSFKIGDQMNVNFSGSVEILPENTDALSTNIELTKIAKVELEKK